MHAILYEIMLPQLNVRTISKFQQKRQEIKTLFFLHLGVSHDIETITINKHLVLIPSTGV